MRAPGKAAAGAIAADDRVVALLTASGLKDPAATAAAQGELPAIGGDAAAVLAQLKAGLRGLT